MGFYKPGANHTSDPRMARFNKITWSLIFGGLLLLTFGIFVGRADDFVGWTMVAAGGVMTVAGMILIYVRSTLKP